MILFLINLDQRHGVITMELQKYQNDGTLNLKQKKFLILKQKTKNRNN